MVRRKKGMGQKAQDGITRKSYEQMDEHSKLNVLFDYSVQTQNRLTRLEKKIGNYKIKTSVYSSISGMIGGAIAFISSFLFKFGGK